MAKTPRTWTGARTPSGLKRVRQAERRREILQPRRTAAKTFVAKALSAASGSIVEVVGLAAAVSAFATNVFAALRRGWRTSWRLWA